MFGGNRETHLRGAERRGNSITELNDRPDIDPRAAVNQGLTDTATTFTFRSDPLALMSKSFITAF